MKISVVIPAHNEEKRIAPTVRKVEDFFSARKLDWQLIVVDDGSSDNTVRTAKDAVGDGSRIKIISHETNLGKGAAVKSGMCNSDGDYVLFMDADSSTDIGEFDKFLPLIEKKIPVIIGSRKVKGSLIEKRQPFLREFFGKGFTLLSNLMLGVKFSDFTCGFKCFSREAARKISELQTINNWSFDSEILYLVDRMKFNYAEVPVKWKNDPASNVRIIRDILTSFWGLVKINLNRILGKYDR